MPSREEPVVLKWDRLFLVQPSSFDPDRPDETAGLYFEDTRFLRGLGWRLGGQPLAPLSSAVQASARAQIDMTNHAFVDETGHAVPAGVIHLRVTVVVRDRLYVRLRLRNFGAEPCRTTLRVHLSADFRDIFEVRGWTRQSRGVSEPPVAAEGRVQFAYTGRDGVGRRTVVDVGPEAVTWETPAPGLVVAALPLHLVPDRRWVGYLTATPVLGDPPPVAAGPGWQFTHAASQQARDLREWQRACTTIETDDAQLNAALAQAAVDLHALFSRYPDGGQVVDAGIPWYAAPFGRDAAITSIEALLLTPAVAEASLRFLAARQGTRVDPSRDEEPGKILHEWRRGEMARAGEIPHTPYYGSLDATPWWIVALYETWRFTNNRTLLEELRDPLYRAVDWILRYGDRDGDGLLEYQRQAPGGLDNQSWKDSEESVLDDDGRPLRPPIAPVEVQGYAYRALKAAGEMAAVLGDREREDQWRRAAEALRARFHRAFREESGRRFAYVLDGAKRPLFRPVSNVGHLLFCGILPPGDVEAVVRDLFRPELLSGYGIRTLGQSARHFNPMSYHNGSVWPHDNAIIAWGLRVTDHLAELELLADQLHEASRYFPYGRLPELYCGFARRPQAGPVPFPVACDPQAWSTAVPLFLVRLLLGIQSRGSVVHITRPLLPHWLRHVVLRNLAIAGGLLDIEVVREHGITFAHVLKRTGDIRVVIEPA